MIATFAVNIQIGFAQVAPISIGGTVKNAASEPLSGATLVLKEGNTTLSAVSGKNGEYHIAPAHEGAYTLDVRCAGYSVTSQHGVITANDRHLNLNIVLKPLSGGKTEAATRLGPLGTVRFYEGGLFKTAQLKDPTAGGGYSDSASVAGAAMVRQYLIPAPSMPSPSSAASPRSSTAATAPSAGAQLLARRDFAHAAAWFRGALARDPRSARAQMGLGISLYGQGKYGAAVESLRRAASLSPDDPAPELLLAEAVQFAPERQPEVRRQLQRFTATHPSNAEGHYAYAMDLWEIYRLRHAEPTLTDAVTENARAVALAPSFAAAYFQLGILNDEQGMISRAIRQYRRAIRLNPDLAEAHYRLAQDLLHSGASAEARTEMDAYEKLRDKGQQ
ncbi:MAG: tetratricopeptide repeat protein [Terriglobia bacterium]